MDSVLEPLFINTNIEYDLDMTRFPGWEDPVRRHQPKLLIHRLDNCLCNDKHQDLFTLLDSCSDMSLKCTENDDIINLECKETDVDIDVECPENDDNIADSLLNETDVTHSNLEPISVPMLPLSDDSGTDSLFEYLSESYCSENDYLLYSNDSGFISYCSDSEFKTENAKKRKVNFEVNLDDELDDLPYKRAFLDHDVFELVHSLFVDDSFGDSVSKDEIYRGS